MSPRRDITMSAGAVDAFLRSRTEAVVVGLDADGIPSGAVGRITLDGGTVRFALRADDPVAGLFGQDDRACCVVEQFPSYYDIKGVMLHGRAKPAASSDPSQVAFELDVERVVSYDFSKLLER